MFGRLLNPSTMKLLNNKDVRGSLPIFLAIEFIMTWGYTYNKFKNNFKILWRKFCVYFIDWWDRTCKF